MNNKIREQIQQIKKEWISVKEAGANITIGLNNLLTVNEQLAKQQIEGITLADAISRIQIELLKDKEPGSYYHTWQCNLAMCFYDAYIHRTKNNIEPFLPYNRIHEIANLAAVRFLEILCLQTETNIGLTKQNELQNQSSIPPTQAAD